MIEEGEVHSQANEQVVQAVQIEKDYVISWVLYGIASNPFLLENLVFKGGTVLRKVYFPEYRLSEDIDFTWRGEEFNIDVIYAAFQEVCEWVEEEARIPLSFVKEAPHATGNLGFYLHYIGPLGGNAENKSIKVDISPKEMMCEEPISQPVIRPYYDLEEEYEIHCYSLDEVISEKLRSLMQRTEPRDLYDIWYLLEKEGKDIRDYVFCFQDKAKFKDLNPDNLVAVVTGKKAKFAAQWEGRLSKQMNEIPEFEEAWRELGGHWREFDKFIASS